MSQSLTSQLEALRTRALDSMERTKGTANEKLYEGMVTGFDHALNRLENDKVSAAAPDLLAAMVAASEYLSAHGDPRHEGLAEVEKQVNDAIKKAGG